MHKTDGEKAVSIKGGCLEGLNKEVMEQAIHIWTKEAVISIPYGVMSFPEEPPDDIEAKGQAGKKASI